MTISISTPTSNTGSIQNNSTDVLTIGSDNSVSIDTNTLHVDATNNRVGIGTSSPADPLQISHATTSRMRFFETTNSLALTVGQWGAKNRIEGSGGSDLIISNYDASNPIAFYTGSGGGNVERMRIDSNGYVTTPYTPSFMVRKTDANLSGNGVTIVWNDVRSDNGNNYNTSTGKFTAPVTGTYSFSAFALFQGGGDDTACALQFNVNNGATLIYPYTRKATGASYNGVSGSCILELNVNDTVHITSHTSGTQAELFASNAAHNGFSGYLIG